MKTVDFKKIFIVLLIFKFCLSDNKEKLKDGNFENSQGKVVEQINHEKLEMNSNSNDKVNENAKIAIKKFKKLASQEELMKKDNNENGKKENEINSEKKIVKNSGDNKNYNPNYKNMDHIYKIENHEMKVNLNGLARDEILLLKNLLDILGKYKTQNNVENINFVQQNTDNLDDSRLKNNKEDMINQTEWVNIKNRQRVIDDSKDTNDGQNNLSFQKSEILKLKDQNLIERKIQNNPKSQHRSITINQNHNKISQKNDDDENYMDNDTLDIADSSSSDDEEKNYTNNYRKVTTAKEVYYEPSFSNSSSNKNNQFNTNNRFQPINSRIQNNLSIVPRKNALNRNTEDNNSADSYNSNFYNFVPISNNRKSLRTNINKEKFEFNSIPVKSFNSNSNLSRNQYRSYYGNEGNNNENFVNMNFMQNYERMKTQPTKNPLNTRALNYDSLMKYYYNTPY